MKRFTIKNICFLSFCLFLFTTIGFAQNGTVVINQDASINTLLKLKKEINTNETGTKRFKIQIYSGNRAKAEQVKSNYNSKYSEWNSKLVYETPNYKIWVGNFRTQLEADRALVKIRKTFSGAFIFKPLKK
jgi:hypothetical protein